MQESLLHLPLKYFSLFTLSDVTRFDLVQSFIYALNNALHCCNSYLEITSTLLDQDKEFS